MLAITIEEILVGDYSWIAIGPRRGPLGESTRWPELSGDYTTKIFRHTPGPSGTLRDGTLHFSERISWPITPFVGTLGVAPDRVGQGTNALALRPPDVIAPEFGPRSARRHLALARRAGVAACLVRLPTLAFDVDTPDDLARLRRYRPQGETGGLLATLR